MRPKTFLTAVSQIMNGLRSELSWQRVSAHPQKRFFGDGIDNNSPQQECYYCRGTGSVNGSSTDVSTGLSPKPHVEGGYFHRIGTSAVCLMCHGTGYGIPDS